ncbi:hypothetical protein D3C74_422650 [compost metagenome]
MLIALVHHQADAGIAAGIQGQRPQLAYLQPLEPERCALVQPGEIVRLQGELDPADLGMALQRHGLDLLARHIVETDGRSGQQAIRMLDPGGGEGDRLPD